MSRRRISQEKFGSAVDRGQHSSLDALARLIDWVPVDQALCLISCSRCSAWQPRRGVCEKIPRTGLTNSVFAIIPVTRRTQHVRRGSRIPGAAIAPSRRQGATIPSRRKPAVKVGDFQCP